MRYIDADELLNKLSDGLPYKASVKRVLMQAPTADVVPRAEVEELSGKIEDLKLKYVDLAKDHDELIAWGGHIKSKDRAEIRDEVAREIFEEIESVIMRFFRETCYDYSLDNAIAELKKKYLKENKDENQN